MSNVTDTGDEAAGRQAVNALAQFLYTEVGAGSVRALEAVAATLVNAARRSLAAAQAAPGSTDARFGEALRRAIIRQGSDRPFARPSSDDPVFASCLRIARRAVRGALPDATGGAVRFHALESGPSWATKLVPCASIGNFLFYDNDVDSCGSL